jgi:hypothetical protein
VNDWHSTYLTKSTKENRGVSVHPVAVVVLLRGKGVRVNTPFIMNIFGLMI